MYCKVGQKEEAVQVLSQALKVTKTIEDEYVRAWVLALSNIADMYFKIADMYFKIADMYSEAGQKEEAVKILSQVLEVAEKIEDSFLKDSFLFKIVDRFLFEFVFRWTIGGPFDLVIKAAEKIMEYKKRESSLSRIAFWCAEVGQFDQALKAVKAMGNENKKIEALIEIADKYAEAKQEPSQKEIALLSEIILEKYPIESFYLNVITQVLHNGR